MSLFDRLKYLQERVHAACRRSGRRPQEITIVAVTKTIPVARIREAAALGLRTIGENRVQEAWGKVPQLRDIDLSWHLIGHLQTNKAKRALQFADIIESVDSWHLAQELSRTAGSLGKEIEIFLEINTSEEANKYGAAPKHAAELGMRIAALPHLHLTGLMTIGAWTKDNERIRTCFTTLRHLKDQIVSQGLQLQHLSMGMSDDFEIAIEEGATILRIGRAIFGERI